jgi:transcriptional regulator with XRE-family HTH domain
MSEPYNRRQALTQSVAGEVRAHLGRQRLSGRAAAFRLGWTQQYMSRRLTGAIPFDVADLDALAELLDVPVTAFFDAPVAALSAGFNSRPTSTPVFPFRTQGALAA